MADYPQELLDPDETRRISVAVKALDPAPRSHRWGHMSLCVLDATYSINLDYDSVVSPLVHRYARHAKLSSVLISATQPPESISPRNDEQSLSEFLDSIAEITDEELAAAVLKSRTRTSTRSGVLKSTAVRQIAQTLVDEGIERLEDVPGLLLDLKRVASLEARLNRIKGAGNAGVRTSYLWMVAGDEDHVKPDRHVLCWLERVIQRPVTVLAARHLLSAVADELGCSAWSVDHAIWNDMAR